MGARKPVERLLVTEVRGLAYDFKRHFGQLYMPEGCCCDMTGCIKLFKRIDSGVLTIYTYSGDKTDTTYRRFGDQWKAYDHEGRMA